MEKEIKFEISGDGAAALRKLPLLRRLQVRAPREVKLLSEYFDTRDLLLRHAGVSLRIRREGKRSVQTLKGPSQTRAGLFEREEFETEVTGGTPQLGSLKRILPPESELAKIMDAPDLSARLQPAFTVSNRRLLWPLKLAEGEEIELALDTASVRAGTRQQDFCELELELKQGEDERLFQLALQLAEQLDLSLGFLSKSDRGYALLGAESPASIKASPVKLKRHDSVEQAFIAIMANCLEQIHGNAAGVASGRSPEAVHQMRVGLRRLRSALKNFESVLSLPETLQAELKWLAATLGQSRDSEVLAFTTFPQLRVPSTRREELARAESIVARQAISRREEAAQALRSPRCARLFLGLELWLQQAPWRDKTMVGQGSMPQQALRDFARDRLLKSHRKLLRRGRHLPRLEGTELHQARIAAKQMRYTMEFFASLFPPGVSKRCLRRLSRLQDVLGSRNDLQVAERLLQKMSGQHPSLDFARGVLAATTAQSDGVSKPQWRRFKNATREMRARLKSAA